MKIKDYHTANIAYEQIKSLETKKTKLYELKQQIKEILKGHTEIPEEKVFEAWNRIDDLCKYLDAKIESVYKKIEEL
jgi:hypothetical protein